MHNINTPSVREETWSFRAALVEQEVVLLKPLKAFDSIKDNVNKKNTKQTVEKY